MPVKPTFLNVAFHSWNLIQQINGRYGAAGSMKEFLGKAATRIVSSHFPGGWLDRITVQIHNQPGVPTPDLDALWHSMAYPDQATFQQECDKIDNHLFSVLQAFSAGAFTGITYDSTIHLSSHYDDFGLSFHELVHTLQWDHFGPVQFLNKYIQGFALNFPVYQMNPAETVAYGFEGRFRSKLSRVDPTWKLISNWKSAIPFITSGMRDAEAKLTANPLHVTQQSAVRGM